jgi:hypothetical protein
MPRWVKMFMIGAAALIVLIVAVMVAMGGHHGHHPFGLHSAGRAASSPAGAAVPVDNR